MTPTTNARIAGGTFLVYIAAGVAGMAGASGQVLSVALALVMCFSALVLGVTLYAITRDQNAEIAMLGMACRVAEGILGGMFMPFRLALRLNPEVTPAVTAFVLSARSLNTLVAAMFFAAGSTLFCWLLLRGRTIPAALAWLGLVASILLVVFLPLQLAGVVSGGVTQIVWAPMAAFEIPVGIWLLVKGVRVQ